MQAIGAAVDPDLSELRYLALQRRAMRRALVRAARDAAATAVALGIFFALFDGVAGRFALAVNLAFGLSAIGVARLSRHRLRRRPTELAFAIGTAWFAVVVIDLALVPAFHTLLVGFLAIVLVAGPLFFPWSEAVHRTWVGVVVVFVAAFAVSPFAAPLGDELREVVLTAAAGAAVSLVGQRLSERRRRESFADRERLRRALGLVRGLTGLLPVCAGCKRVHDEADEWIAIERYVSERSRARFSHGLCPDCMRRLYPDFVDDPPAA